MEDIVCSLDGLIKTALLQQVCFIQLQLSCNGAYVAMSVTLSHPMKVPFSSMKHHRVY